MVLDPQFLLWMPYLITVEPFSSLSTDAYGSRVVGTAYQVKARIEQEARLYVDKTGREIRCNATVFTPPYDATTGANAITIKPQDRITLPAGLFIAGTSRPPVLECLQHADETGTMYFEVLL